MAIVLLLLLLFKSHTCEDSIGQFFQEINEITRKFNGIGADIVWKSSIDPGKPGLVEMSEDFQRKKIYWMQKVCQRLAHLHDHHTLNVTQERQEYLMCRGPNYTMSEAREVNDLYEELQSIYSDVELCIPNDNNRKNITAIEEAILKLIADVQKYVKKERKLIIFNKREGMCLKGERDFEMIMEKSRNSQVLEWIWLIWRGKMKEMKEPYDKMVELENRAARRNGYTDIGACWRDELEILNVRQFSQHLYDSVKPLYVLLHGVVRYFLRRHYGDAVPEKGPIPAHLLGDLWSQNWEPLADLILPKNIDLDERLKNLNWTVIDMVKKAEDFYISLGLPPMTDTFWRESIFTREAHKNARCHGTAADMYKHGDFRLLHCCEMSFKDFYVIHHEMGHIQYYMAYENQPGLFRNANSFLHETIGDTIMQAVMTPQHLHRLRIINDSELFNTNSNKDINFIERAIKRGQTDLNYEIFDTKTESTEDRQHNFENSDKITIDDILIIKQALNKIPQIPFSFIIDQYRWRYFEGSLDKNYLNEEFWEITQNIQGIAPPNQRGHDYFDIGAKFHVPDNTPYMRYFLSNILQHQLFENLCKAAVFGHRNIKDPLPFSIYLNRCDIYGSKTAGKILKDLMSRGNSQHWQRILQETIGDNNISSAALKRYYRPLYKILIKLVEKYRIPIGW